MQKIVIVQTRYKATAGCSRWIAYAKGFAEAGFPVTVLYLTRSVDDPVPPAIPNVNYVFPRHAGRKSPIQLMDSFWRLFRLLRKNDFLFLDTALFQAQYIIGCLKKSILCHEITEHPLIKSIKYDKILWSEKINLRLFKSVDHLFVISQRLKSYLQEKGISDATVVNMFVDPDRFAVESTASDTQKYIKYCGTVSNYKDGVDTLIKAFSIVHERYPEYKLQVIGPVENRQLKLQLDELVASLGVEEAVEFTGTITPSLLPQALISADILALARPDNFQAEYGFPTKLGEYLCTGKPVVITRTGEIPLFLEDKISCIFATPDSPEDFAEQLMWCISHEQEAREIGLNGLNVARTSFSYKTQSRIVVDELRGRTER